MLETKELYKVYKPKKGVAVTAINKISLKFPEKGMIFLLGKSGSGKSTLLNLLGGLDKYDSGEIIIKGVSSKDFNQQHFDSYRNTYVGFIFQEYNILDEFSVGANIALALELQGKKATDEEINHILKEVDLDGYGNRKPNELSGGQKQRVAIARALVKNPEIIMADEPTGALDSNTGRQVFDTLKKLSQKKLIIIVSHDREFSELYADRIIELSDGNVISDVEIDAQADEEEKKGNLRYQGATIELAPGYHLTEEDRAAINAYIDRITDSNLNLKLTGNGMAAKKFIPTNQDNIKQQDGSSFQLIKSKLPLKSAFKIGASGLKYKKFRLVMTILLSCISFGLFGLADTFGSYKHIDACTNSLIDTGVDYVSLVKAIKQGEGINSYYNSRNTSITKEELEEIEKINTKNSYTVKIEAHNEIIDDEISPISKDIEEAMTKSLEDGTGNCEELKNKGEIYIAYNDVFEEIFGYRFKVGDKIKLHYFNGKENSMELTVGGVGNSSFSKYGKIQGWILLQDDIYEEITQNLDTTTSLEVTTKNHIYNDEIDNKVKDLVREYEEIDCETFSQWREQAIKNSKSFSNILIGISIFVILFSLINLINTVITSMVTRKREIAVLQSMGMTKRQVNKMIIFENVCLAIPNCLVSSIVGPIVVFIIMKIMQETGIKYLFFKLPVMGIVLYLIISIVIPSIIAIFCIKTFNKESIVDRLREN